MSTPMLTSLRDWLPKGQTLSKESFAVRHRTLRVLLVLHIPPLLIWGIVVGNGVPHAVGEVALPIVTWFAAGKVRAQRVAALFVTMGLTWCSLVMVHLSDGSIEAHFHFFIIIPFITLYQDWLPFLYASSFTVLSHGIGSWLRPDLIFNHADAQRRPWTWAAIHGVAVAWASIGAITFWRAAERDQNRATRYAADLAAQREEAATAREAAHRTFSDLLVTLARRNQHLVERQLQFIDGLEQEEHDERVLGNLFRLDHFATRMRRNAESLMVLSGAEAAPRLTQPQPLSEVIRGAVGEVEDYRRVDVIVHSDPHIAGRALSSLAHLLAELIENATTFSPSSARVLVIGRTTPEGGCQVAVVDSGIGMSDADLERYNQRLADPPEVDVDLVRMLGLHVVGRLARRHDVAVRLERNSLGGLTATVSIPSELLVAGEAPALLGVGAGAADAIGAARGRSPAEPGGLITPATVSGPSGNGRGPGVVAGVRPAPARRSDLVAGLYDGRARTSGSNGHLGDGHVDVAGQLSRNGHGGGNSHLGGDVHVDVAGQLSRNGQHRPDAERDDALVDRGRGVWQPLEQPAAALLDEAGPTRLPPSQRGLSSFQSGVLRARADADDLEAGFRE